MNEILYVFQHHYYGWYLVEDLINQSRKTADPSAPSLRQRRNWLKRSAVVCSSRKLWGF